MKKKTATYFSISIVLIVIAFLLSNCGGGTDSGAIPDVASPQQTQNLIPADVNGYIFHKGSISSSETGEEDNDFPVIEIPMTGDEGFLNQVTGYFQDTSSRVNTEETEELLKAFTEEAPLYQPLPSWQPSAQIFGIYDEIPITLNGDGSFAGTVSADETEDTVGLEIVIPEGDSFEVETIAASEEVTSSDNTGGTLKSCPQKIIIKPGQCEIFKVFSKPATNLYEAGLQFSLANPEIGCLAGPIFIKCSGQKKNSIAYGILYVKKNVDTPLDTSINVTDTQGRSLSLPVQVVQKTASVSGKVYTGGVRLVKGNVKSIGTKSFCHLDSEGNYVLPKTFMGSGRKVIATWWTLEGGKQIKHREVKYVDLYGDMTGVNFGVVPPEPTPTLRPVDDPFYDDQVSIVIHYFEEWRKELGGDQQAIQKVIKWINGNDPSLPPVPEGLSKAYIDEYTNTTIVIEFEDGTEVGIATALMPYPSYQDVITLLDKNSFEQKSINDIIYKEMTPVPITGANATTFKPEKILMLAPITPWQHWAATLPGGGLAAHFQIARFLNNDPYYKDKTKTVITNALDIDFEFYKPTPEPEDLDVIPCKVGLFGDRNNIVTPWDYGNLVNDPNHETMCDYGFVFIETHGDSDSILACLDVYDHPEIQEWKSLHRPPNVGTNIFDTWRNDYQVVDWWQVAPPHCTIAVNVYGYLRSYIKVISLKKSFFETLYTNLSAGQDSIVFISACHSGPLHSAFPGVVYLGTDDVCNSIWTFPLGYYYFQFMLFGYQGGELGIRGYTGPSVSGNPTPIPYQPMHIRQAHDALEYYFNVNPDPGDYTIFPYSLFPGEDCYLQLHGPYKELYFPVPAQIIVQEE